MYTASILSDALFTNDCVTVTRANDATDGGIDVGVAERTFASEFATLSNNGERTGCAGRGRGVGGAGNKSKNENGEGEKNRTDSHKPPKRPLAVKTLRGRSLFPRFHVSPAGAVW